MCPECLAGVALMAAARAASTPKLASFIAPSAMFVARTLRQRGQRQTKPLLKTKGERDGSSKNRLANAVGRCP